MNGGRDGNGLKAVTLFGVSVCDVGWRRRGAMGGEEEDAASPSPSREPSGAID